MSAAAGEDGGAAVLVDWMGRQSRGGGEIMRHLRIALAQINVTVGDLEGNAARIMGAIL